MLEERGTEGRPAAEGGDEGIGVVGFEGAEEGPHVPDERPSHVARRQAATSRGPEAALPRPPVQAPRAAARHPDRRH